MGEKLRLYKEDSLFETCTEMEWKKGCESLPLLIRVSGKFDYHGLDSAEALLRWLAERMGFEVTKKKERKENG